MNLETIFKESDIEDIYNSTVMYSILKYQNLPKDWQEFFQSRYHFALKKLAERNIDYSKIKREKIEYLQSQLINYQHIYNQALEQNKPVIDITGPMIEKLIIDRINTKETEIEKLSFLFDFITSYLTYSEDYFNYCLKVPPIAGFDFDFKEKIPVDTSMNGLLVIGQGLCDDISNLMIHLGRRLNLNIDKIFATYKENNHSLNMITLKDGNSYLIDATRKIRKDKSKAECFLVSTQVLNQQKEYIFKEDMPTQTYHSNIPNIKKR